MAPHQNDDPMHDLKVAFTPRTLDGHKIGMLFDDEPPETLLFPCAHPHPDGTFDPMIFAKDCAGGKRRPITLTSAATFGPGRSLTAQILVPSATMNRALTCR